MYKYVISSYEEYCKERKQTPLNTGVCYICELFFELKKGYWVREIQSKYSSKGHFFITCTETCMNIHLLKRTMGS